MTERLLEGLRVVDLGGDPAARAARVLGDLGASVERVVPPEGDVLAGNVARAWNAGKRIHRLAADDPELDALLRDADVVFDTPGVAGTHVLDPGRAPDAVWVHITPFGLDGPRASWRASNLGVMAASGNMYVTGDPDRAPVRCAEPTAYAHSGARSGVRGADGVVVGSPPAGRRVDARGRRQREHGRAGRVRANRGTRVAPRRQHRAHPRDLAYERRVRVVRPARRQGPRREPRAHREARRAARARLEHLEREHRDRRRAEGARRSGRHLLRAAHDARALRRRVRDEPDAGADQLTARDLRVGAARVAGLLRSGRRRRPLSPRVRDRAFRRRPRRPGRPSRRADGRQPGRRLRRVVSEAGARQAGVGGTQDPGVRFGGCGADRDAVLRRAGRNRVAHRIEDATRLPAHHGARRPDASARARGRAALRRSQRREAQPHPEPQEARVGRARASPRRGVGRRGRRELRAARDEGLRSRLRLTRRGAARPRDGEHVLERPDRAAQGLPGVRWPGLGARGIQRAHGLARSRTLRAVRHDHRLTRAALCRGRARGRVALPPADRPRCVPRRLAGRVGDLVARTVAARLRDRRRGSPARRQRRSPRAPARRVRVRRRRRCR